MEMQSKAIGPRRSVSLTRRRLVAIEGALSAMLAGYEGEGDWPDGVTRDDMESAHSWALEQLAKREARA